MKKISERNERTESVRSLRDIPARLLALTLALQSYADGLACRRIMERLREKTPKPETKARKNKK